MRVLLVTHYFPEHRGGVEIIAGELARRLGQRGVEVDWVASGGEAVPETNGPRRIAAPAWNITERRLGFPYPLWGPFTLIGLGRRVARCDVVHLHDSLYLGNAVAFLWASWHRKPVVVTQHIGTVPYSQRLLRALLGLANRTIARIVLGGSDQVVFYSPRVQSYFSRLVRFRRPPLFMPNGVDTARFSPVSEAQRQTLRTKLSFPADAKVRLFVGRFVEKKGLPLLRQLAAVRPRDLWVFIGWGSDDPARWGMGNVLCPGGLSQEAIADYYRAADILVLPSVGEGFPLVVQEAMACGLPVLISPETLEGAPDASTVIEIAELNVSAWNRAIERLDAVEDDAGHRRRIAEFTQRWNWDNLADRFVDLFKSLLHRRVHGAPMQ